MVFQYDDSGHVEAVEGKMIASDCLTDYSLGPSNPFHRPHHPLILLAKIPVSQFVRLQSVLRNVYNIKFEIALSHTILVIGFCDYNGC